MRFLKTAFHVFLLVFLPASSAFVTKAQANDTFTDLLTEGQIWNQLSDSQKKISGTQLDAIMVRKGGKEKTYETLSLGSQGFVLTEKASGARHYFPIPIKRISDSLHYLFLIPAATATERTEATGFYVIRLIDLHHYVFHSPIPVFFIPTDSKLGPLEDVSSTEEGTLLQLKSSLKEVNPEIMSVKDMEKIIQAKLLLWAIHQTFVESHNSELEKLIESFKKNMETLQENFYAELKTIGGEDASQLIPEEFRTLDWEKTSAEALAEALSKVDDHPQLQNLKLQYAEYFRHVIQDFYTRYNEIIETMDLSYAKPTTLPTPRDVRKDDHTQQPTSLIPLEDDTKTALKYYAGIAGGVVFVTLVLPKVFKKPFSQLAADYSGWHTENVAFIRKLIRFFHPQKTPQAQTVETILAKLLPAAEKEAPILGSQYKRAVWQRVGDNFSIFLSELAARPIFRYIEDQDAKKSIMINEPFDETHSLWLQKDFLYRVIGGQILGPMTSTINIYILEREYNSILRYFVLQDPSNILSLTEKQKLAIAKTVREDIQALQDAVKKGGNLPSVSELKRNWLKTMEKNGIRVTRDMAHFLEAKIRTLCSVITQEPTPQKIGFFKKCLNALGIVVHKSMSKVVGAKATTEARVIYSKSWEIWKDLNETYLWNGVLMQTATRGSFNGTLFLYQRATSLLFTTPTYVGGFRFLKNKGFLNGDADREAWFGFAHGLVTNFLTNYIFVQAYYDHIHGSQFDLEFSKYFSSENVIPRDLKRDSSR